MIAMKTVCNFLALFFWSSTKTNEYVFVAVWYAKIPNTKWQQIVLAVALWRSCMSLASQFVRDS